jgi:hypothetical protein
MRALSLYRSLLRAHQHCLPADMRPLGDTYVRSEFKMHRTKASPSQLEAFVREWETYLDHIQRTARAHSAVSVGSVDPASAPATATDSIFTWGADLPPDIPLSEEQQRQLEKLREEAIKVAKKSR